MDIIVSDLSKAFGEKTVLSGFSAVFPENKISCIMGASGCGKTTLFRIMLGLEKADAGSIKGLPEHISAVFQEDRLCPGLSAYKNVQLSASEKYKKEDIENVLTSLGLKESINIPASQLSGGMQRRVSIARAVLYDTPLILLDEPFKGLDNDTKQTVMDYIRISCRNRTVILITHDASEASSLSENTIFM